MTMVSDSDAKSRSSDQSLDDLTPVDVRLPDFVAAAAQGLVRGLSKGGEVELTPQPEPSGIQTSPETVVHQWTVGLTYTRYVALGSGGKTKP